MILDRPPSTKLNALLQDLEYVNRVKALSDNIVALGFKPQIHEEPVPNSNMDQLEVPKYFTTEPHSPGMPLSPVLKYVKQERPSKEKMEGKKSVKDQPLFEDFFVIGLEKEDIAKFIAENPTSREGSLPAKILYNFPGNPDLNKLPPRSSLPEFTFPFGCDFKKLRSSPSFSSLNSIIYTPNDYEQRTKCFVFPLLSGDLVEHTKMNDMIEASNPSHLLYIVCLSFKDFINMSPPNTPKKSYKDMSYWEVNKLMCFMTYYPFTNFFFDALMKFLNMIKVERMLQLTSPAMMENVARHQDLDHSFTQSYFETVIKRNLERLLAEPLSDFNTSHPIVLQCSHAEYKVSLMVEEHSKPSFLEAIWGCPLVFSYIGLKDLIWLFSALLLEKKLVFLSKNIHLLTAVLSVLRSLIKPFRYPFPLIFNLPEVLMVLCDAPGAALIGINKDEEYFLAEQLEKEYPSCIYICLDEERIYDALGEKFDLPYFDNFEKTILTTYVKLNPQLDYHLVETTKNRKLSGNKKLKLTANSEEKQLCIKILEMFQNTLVNKIIDLIPPKPIYTSEKELDYQAIKSHILDKTAPADENFIAPFLSTQIFTYYLEQHYEIKSQ